jgi:hypothetical protein
MWRELDNIGQMIDRKICPIISDSCGRILCQGLNCYAAYPQILMSETLWFCTIIDGPGPAQKSRGEELSQLLGDHEQ